MKHPELFQPAISFGGLTINEPVTMISDFLIAIICLIAFFKIKKNAVRGNNYYPVLIFFFCMFFSTFWGGLVGHGLQYYLSPLWKIPSWFAGILSVVAFQVIASNQIRTAHSRTQNNLLLFLNLASFLIAIYMVFAMRVFAWVQFHAVFGILVIVLPIQLLIYFRTKSVPAGKLLLGISFAIGAALVHLFYLGLGKWFNHLDVSHILLAVSNLFFYFGLEKLTGTEQVNHSLNTIGKD